MRRLPPNQPNRCIRREHDARAFRHLVVLLACGLVLAGGFVFAAAQHFAAVQYGYRSEALRRERAQLLEEQRRLLLAHQEAAAPARLANAARGIGMQPVEARQINAVRGVTRTLPHSAAAFVNPSASALNR